MVMNYDRMIAVNREKSEEKIRMAFQAIETMSSSGAKISVTELVKWTGLSRGFFYNNAQVRQKMLEAAGRPRVLKRWSFQECDRAGGEELEKLKKEVLNSQEENQRLIAERDQLLQRCDALQKEIAALKKRVDRKEMALLKKL